MRTAPRQIDSIAWQPGAFVDDVAQLHWMKRGEPVNGVRDVSLRDISPRMDLLSTSYATPIRVVELELLAQVTAATIRYAARA